MDDCVLNKKFFARELTYEGYLGVHEDKVKVGIYPFMTSLIISPDCVGGDRRCLHCTIYSPSSVSTVLYTHLLVSPLYYILTF